MKTPYTNSQTNTLYVIIGALICWFSTTTLLAQTYTVNGHELQMNDSLFRQLNSTKIAHVELPKIEAKDEIVQHLGYTLSYNEQHEQANWVAYELTKDETTKRVNRSNHFEPDPAVTTGSATDADYSHSGYDRGHLAPAADMAWSEQSMQESFYYSNMSPQNPSFNRGIWKHLEEQVRNWAIDYNTIYVVTGPVLRKGLYAIGPNHVSIPEAYYKVVLHINNATNTCNGIGFLLPNEGSKASLSSFVLPIDSIEHLTGINFFDKLPPVLEKVLESKVCLPCWNWNPSHSNESTKIENSHQHTLNQHQSQPGEKVQCSGITKMGNRCKRMTSNANGRCYQHN